MGPSGWWQKSQRWEKIRWVVQLMWGAVRKSLWAEARPAAMSVVNGELRGRDRTREESCTSHMPVLTHSEWLPQVCYWEGSGSQFWMYQQRTQHLRGGNYGSLKFILMLCHLDVESHDVISLLPSLKGIMEGRHWQMGQPEMGMTQLRILPFTGMFRYHHKE